MKKMKYFIGISVVAVMLSACEQEIAKNSGITDPVLDPSKKPTGVVTGDVLTNKGNSASFSLTVGGGESITDVGVVLVPNDTIEKYQLKDWDISTKGAIFSQKINPQAGESQVEVKALSIGTEYNYRAYSMNANGITYGEIKEFTTLAVFFTPYITDFSDSPGARDYWYLDGLTGTGEDDLVWWFDPTEAGAPASWGQSIAAYHDGAPLTIHSPQISISENDTLSFQFYIGLFTGEATAKIKVYITEDLDNLGSPVKDWTLAAGGRTAIPLAEYVNKMVYVVWIVEQGNVFFYHFAIAPTTDLDELFP